MIYKLIYILINYISTPKHQFWKIVCISKIKNWLIFELFWWDWKRKKFRKKSIHWIQSSFSLQAEIFHLQKLSNHQGSVPSFEQVFTFLIEYLFSLIYNKWRNVISSRKIHFLKSSYYNKINTILNIRILVVFWMILFIFRVVIFSSSCVLSPERTQISSDWCDKSKIIIL